MVYVYLMICVKPKKECSWDLMFNKIFKSILWILNGDMVQLVHAIFVQYKHIEFLHSNIMLIGHSGPPTTRSIRGLAWVSVVVALHDTSLAAVLWTRTLEDTASVWPNGTIGWRHGSGAVPAVTVPLHHPGQWPDFLARWHPQVSDSDTTPWQYSENAPACA